MKKVLLAVEPGMLIDKLRGLLAKAEAEVFTAATAEDALEIHVEQRTDLVLADLDLPVMGGDGLCQRIRAEEEEFKRAYVALICSGKKAELERCGRCGANSFVKQPLEPGDMAERISLILKSPEHRATRVLAKVTVEGIVKNEPFYCTSRNISVTGILLETDRTLAKGDTIACSFFLPDLDRVEVKGKVARVLRGEESMYLCGVEFMDISAEQRAAIWAFVEKKRSEGNFM